jgi:hypothetical protein
MHRTRLASALAAALVWTAATGLGAEVSHQHLQHGQATKPPADARLAVQFPPELKEHTLENMRDHLATLQRIQEALARGAFDSAAEIAETRLGMGSLQSHGAHEVAKFMPQGMQDIGTGMHKAASRFALEAANAGATGDLRAPLAALSAVTAQCVSCHAGYRLR